MSCVYSPRPVGKRYSIRAIQNKKPSRCGFTGQAIAGKIGIYVQVELKMFWVIFDGSDGVSSLYTG